MDAYLVIGNNTTLEKIDLTCGDVFGIDKGAHICFKNNIKMKYAVGDFDSISCSDLDKIKEVTEVIKLNPIKDDSDTAHAVGMCDGYDRIFLLGSIQGKRIEHLLANINLCINDERIILIDDFTQIRVVKSGEELIPDEYKFISFYPIDDVYGLDLIGFKYELSNYTLKRFDSLCLSNEIVKEKGIIKFNKGRMLMVKSISD